MSGVSIEHWNFPIAQLQGWNELWVLGRRS